jgi:hypothetical protein
MRVVIAGATGLIGTAVRRSYELDGHDVVRLVRRASCATGEVRWDPAAPLDPAVLEGVDVVVNLAGAGIGEQRWTREYRRVILHSRTNAARTLGVAVSQAPTPPKVLISASGIRYYGVDRGEEILTESTPSTHSGFLCLVANAWEAATEPATDAGIRVCHLRLGLVLTGHGGVLPRLLPFFRRGVGASFGSGQQYWSHVSLHDTVRAIRFLAAHPRSRGPYNITAPDPVTNNQFTKALAEALDKPARLRVPGPALRLALGGVASDALGGLRVLPARLTEAGFRHHHPDVTSVLNDALNDSDKTGT